MFQPRMRDLGNKICILMKENNITYKNMSEETGISIRNIKKVIKGKKILSYKQLIQVSEFLKTDIKDFMSNIEDKYPENIDHILDKIAYYKLHIIVKIDKPIYAIKLYFQNRKIEKWLNEENHDITQ